jgi:hypothetical protein
MDEQCGVPGVHFPGEQPRVAGVHRPGEEPHGAPGPGVAALGRGGHACRRLLTVTPALSLNFTTVVYIFSYNISVLIREAKCTGSLAHTSCETMYIGVFGEKFEKKKISEGSTRVDQSCRPSRSRRLQ